jgi:hypothetical protein
MSNIKAMHTAQDDTAVMEPETPDWCSDPDADDDETVPALLNEPPGEINNESDD